MNKATIVRKRFTLYLKVTGEPLDKPVYFEIESYSDKNTIGKEISLTKEFLINLSGKKYIIL
jgi:hypothetical protein